MNEKKPTIKQASYVALAIVGVFLLVRSGGFAALQPFMKYIIPLGVLYYGYRKIKQKFLPITRMAQEIHRQQEEMKARGASKSEGPTIEICSKCGTEIGPAGRCACET